MILRSKVLSRTVRACVCACVRANAQDTKNSIMSFVSEDDLICRASLGGIRQLARRLRILAFVRRAKCVRGRGVPPFLLLL